MLENFEKDSFLAPVIIFDTPEGTSILPVKDMLSSDEKKDLFFKKLKSEFKEFKTKYYVYVNEVWLRENPSGKEVKNWEELPKKECAIMQYLNKEGRQILIQYDIDRSENKPKLINRKEFDTQTQMDFDGKGRMVDLLKYD